MHKKDSVPYLLLFFPTKNLSHSIVSHHFSKGRVFSPINMRLLVLSGSALLTCAFLAFGRPLVARREMRNLNQNFPLLHDRDGTSAGAPYMLPHATSFPALPDPNFNSVSTPFSPVLVVTNKEIPQPNTRYTSLLPALSDEHFNSASASASHVFTPVSPEVGKSESSTDDPINLDSVAT